MDAERRQALIAKYREGPDVVAAAVADAAPSALDAVPGAGEWTARQVVHHLADSEMTSGIRLRRLLAEDAPVIDAYDENEFARRLHYDRPIDASLACLRAVRAVTAEILDRLNEDDWARAGTHTESGAYSVETWLAVYADHAHDHADQIRRALASTT